MIARKILFEQSHLDYVEHSRRLHNLSSGNEAMRCILEQHQLYFSQTEGSVGQIIAAMLEEKYSEFLCSIRASTQSTERNSQIMLELFNTLFLNQFTNISHATLTSLYECDPIAEARKAVQENLAAQCQRKFSK